MYIESTLWALIAVVCVMIIIIIYFILYQLKTQQMKGSFVGSMAQNPHLVPCAFRDNPISSSSTWNMNRCNYI